jgi:hypothetical protein
VDQTSGSVTIAVEARPVVAAPAPPAAAPVPPAAPAADTPAARPQAPAPVADAPAAAVRPGGAGTGDPLADHTVPTILMPAPADFAFARPAPIDLPDATRSLGAGPRLLVDVNLLGFADPAGGEFQLTGLSTRDFGVNGLTVQDFQQSLRSGVFIEELNRLRNELREEFDLDKTLSVSVAGVSLGVSVIYILWLVRGGVLLGSYLSALPAWRLLDPLPVLARAGEEEEDEDDETFDSQAERGPDPLRGFS